MKDKSDPSSIDMARALANEFGDQLIESRVPLQVKVNATAILHASICYSNGLDMHTAVEAVMTVYKQIEKHLGKP
jgi:hypothetical protein